eukprot:15446054-Alexandrium_andersonii.AAC.1
MPRSLSLSTFAFVSVPICVPAPFLSVCAGVCVSACARACVIAPMCMHACLSMCPSVPVSIPVYDVFASVSMP